MRALIGLFVDDERFAVSIVAWLLIAGFVLPRVIPPGWSGFVLFAGLAAILMESAIRRARR